MSIGGPSDNSHTSEKMPEGPRFLQVLFDLHFKPYLFTLQGLNFLLTGWFALCALMQFGGWGLYNS